MEQHALHIWPFERCISWRMTKIILTGADTVEEAQVLIRQIIALLSEGGFPSPKILDFLPKDQKALINPLISRISRRLNYWALCEIRA
ncbi:hypothetical protein LAZ67_6003152 [Cordylochernes scorpioides]|uniref:Uncharacterized protein n=1 Tax=Cordylochernes scorpioides TaxID=51811 RepID=A0ABY6KKB3_9ARAC|nr:hypothetical protein LAZ67_6003152 [Cordylochernes scorpioides]